MRKLVILSALFALGLAASAMPNGAAAQELKPLKIALGVNALHWYPSYVARAAGLFREEGLADEWIDVGSGTNAVAAVMGGDVAMTMQGVDHAMMASLRGGDLVAFAALFDAYALPLVLTNAAMEKAGIDDSMPVDEKIKRLEGLTIAITSAGSATDEILRNMMRVRGIDPDIAVQIQPLGSADAMLAAFSNGLVDGMVTTAPYPQIAESQGLGKTIISPLRNDLPEMVGVPYSAALTSRAIIERDPELILGVTRALAKAIKLTRDDPQQVREMLRQYFPSIEPDVFDAMEEAHRNVAAQSTVVTLEAFEKLAAWKNLSRSDDEKLNPSYEQAVVTEFAERADAEILGGN